MLPYYRYMVIWSGLYTVHGGFIDWTNDGLGMLSFSNELWNGGQYYQSPELQAQQRDPNSPISGQLGQYFFDDMLEGMREHGVPVDDALDQFEALHEELAGSGVHVTALCPGFTRTKFVDAAGAAETASRIPDVIWMEPDPVAAAGLRAVAANRATVVPGLQYKLSTSASRVLPSAVTRRVLAVASRLRGI